MKNVTSILLIIFVFLFVSISASTVLADPTVVRVTIDPAKPLPLSTITFNTTILSSENIDEVRLLVQECREDLCFIYSFNLSMEKTANDTYQAQCTLIQQEATQIKYYLKIVCNETWYTSDTTFTPLALDTKKNTTQDSHDPVSTPGFEIPLLVLSIVLIVVINQWGRKSGRKL
jgi:hypothetical protein